VSLERLECSLWTNGSTGWGIKILGGADLRRKFFERKLGPIVVEIDGVDVPVNIDKNSFWNSTCGELINKSFRTFKERHNLTSGERLWLTVVEPLRRFRLDLN